jgi:hypothetical protein
MDPALVSQRLEVDDAHFTLLYVLPWQAAVQRQSQF